MSALVIGFRETLEAAVIMALLIVAVRRLGHGHLAQPAWYGLGAGLLFGLSVAMGLASVRVGVGEQTFVTLQLMSLGPALLALVGVALWMRRRGPQAAVDADEASEAPGAWLVIASAFFAALPQSLELAVRLAKAAPVAGLLSLPVAVLGLGGGIALSIVFYMGLMRCNPARLFRPVLRRELATVAQKADDRRG